MLLDKDTLIKVRNRDNGTVGYVIPELGNLRREFARGETKEITMDELRKLSWVNGGKALLKNYLVVENADAIAELLGEVEPEYNYTEEDVKELLVHGSLDAFLDCLDYAPEGVISLVKQLAVDTKLNDIAKRNAIFEKTGFNVTRAIELNEEVEGDEEEETKATKTRRVATPTTTTGRRTAAPTTDKYVNVVIKENK